MGFLGGLQGGSHNLLYALIFDCVMEEFLPFAKLHPARGALSVEEDSGGSRMLAVGVRLEGLGIPEGARRFEIGLAIPPTLSRLLSCISWNDKYEAANEEMCTRSTREKRGYLEMDGSVRCPAFLGE